MKGVIFTHVGADPKIVEDLKQPTPGPDQVLVKSLWTAINPVDSIMSSTGLLVQEWPLVMGVDAGGVIVEAGDMAISDYGVKVGGHVFGCTRLGSLGYSAAQEYFLMDAQVAIPKPKNITVAQAATMGVAAETACLGLFKGLEVEIPEPKHVRTEHDEWIVILGGTTSVGRFAIQLARACGYKVVASTSVESAGLAETLGAHTFNYKLPIDQQLEEVVNITGKRFAKIFDTTASEDPVLARKLFKATEWPRKLFSSTNDWSNITGFEGVNTYGTNLSIIGRPEAKDLNATIASYLPVIVSLIEEGHVKPTEYVIIGDGGFEDLIRAYNYQRSGEAGPRKVVVRIQD